MEPARSLDQRRRLPPGGISRRLVEPPRPPGLIYPLASASITTSSAIKAMTSSRGRVPEIRKALMAEVGARLE
jgi:hypothetical protein